MNNVYAAIALTGNTGGTLDNIDGATLNQNDAALVVTSTYTYMYQLNATSGATASTPTIISPALNAGTKRWILISCLASSVGCDTTQFSGLLTSNESNTQLALNKLDKLRQRRTITSSYTALTTDATIFANTSTGSITITLYAATSNNILRIAKTSALNSLIILCSGTDTIEGSSSITLTSLNSSVTLHSDAVSTFYTF